jgi:PIN domain nuclease of toxin-antitoxin system
MREIGKARSNGGTAIASISLWELALLFQSGRLRGSGTTERYIEELMSVAAPSILEITPEIAALAVLFPDSYPRDPGDRLIGATARFHDIPLVTQDDRIRESPLIRTIW